MMVRIWLVMVAITTFGETALGVPASCTPDEETVFACRSGRKQISVCASKGWTANSGYVQYRYGTKERAEIVLPGRLDRVPSETITIGGGALSGGGYAFMRFRSRAFRYTVYDSVSGQLGPSSGSVVDRVDRADRYGHPDVVAVHRCKWGEEGQFAGGLLSPTGLPEDEAEREFRVPTRK